jgi:ribose 5-phosphate isomerase A
MDLKEMAAREAVKYVEDDMVVGLGSGTTATIVIKLLGEKVKEGMTIIGIPTSKESEKIAESVGIPIGELRAHPPVDLTIDGADEVDPNLNLIKGLGGALVREKIVASHSNLEVIVVDDAKMVERLGQKAPVPVEILRFAHEATIGRLEKLGCVCKMRLRHDSPFVTDNGNLIVDCRLQDIEDPQKLESAINMIPGVVDNGLFVGMADKVIVATNEGIKILEKNTVLRRVT